MAIVWDDITGVPPSQGIAPELVAFSDAAARAVILELVNTTGLDVANFDGEAGPKTKLARILLAAHFATIFRRRGLGGAVGSQSEGGLSESYSQIIASPTLLDTTSYGQAFHLLCMGTPARAGFVLNFEPGGSPGGDL